MNVSKQKTDTELIVTVELSAEEMKPYLEETAKRLSKDMKIEGFRPGNAPFEVVRQKLGDMPIIQEAANVAVQKTADNAVQEQIEDGDDIVGRPEVQLTKAAPGNALEYQVKLQLAPEVKLGKYKDLGIKQEDATVSDEDVDKVIRNLQDMRTSEALVDREIKDGDKATVGIQMFLDSVPVEGGQTQETGVIIGADYIVPGFDKELIGAKKGDVREFTLKYPETHHQKNLSGKNVDFKVEIKGVYERTAPELNDEFAKSLGTENVDDLKKKIRENLEAEAKQKQEQKVVTEIFEKILAKSTFSHLPEQVVEAELNNMIEELKKNVEQQGGKFDDYLSHIQKSVEDLKKDLKPEAEKRVQTSFVISEIIRQEEIVVTDEELDKAVEERLAPYANDENMKKQADSKELRSYVRYNLLNQKVIGKLKEWNVK